MTGEPIAAGMQGMQAGMLAFLMLAAGAMITMAAAMLRAPSPLLRWTGVLFDLSAAAYAFKLWNDVTQLLPAWLEFPVEVLTVSSIGWFWLFVIALFQDSGRIRPILLAAVGVLTAVGLVGRFVPSLSPMCWLAANVIHIAMALHVLMIVAQGWKGDLVEARRRLRGPFLITVTTYILVTRGFEILEGFGFAPTWYPMTNSGVLAAVCLAGAFVFLESRSDLFGVVQAPATVLRPPARATANGNGHAINGNGRANGVAAMNGQAAQLDRAAKADLERLQALMTTQQVWREEGLTISSLAVKAGMPESQLRRLISDCLGYRNFPSFVNAHRIAAAKARLSDPNEARVTVSTIAYDMGFASLGPFNRAFKEETGVSPSEWRRKSLGQLSPIPADA